MSKPIFRVVDEKGFRGLDSQGNEIPDHAPREAPPLTLSQARERYQKDKADAEYFADVLRQRAGLPEEGPGAEPKNVQEAEDIEKPMAAAARKKLEDPVKYPGMTAAEVMAATNRSQSWVYEHVNKLKSGMFSTRHVKELLEEAAD